MKKSILILFAVAFIFSLAGCASGSGKNEGITAAAVTTDVQPAPARNKIVIYTSMYENAIKSVKEALDAEFPNIDIQFVYGGTGIIQAKIDIEETAKRLGCDMLLVADPSYAIELKQKGMLHSFQSKEKDNLAFSYDPEGYWYPVRVSNMVLVYNPARNSRDAVPHSFQTFASDARSRSMISMGSPHTSGTVLAALSALRDKYTDSYFTTLGRNQLQVNMVSAMAFDKLDSGEYKVLMILEESALQRKQQNPSRVEIIYPSDGTIMIPSPVMIIANSWSANRNVKIAERIADWFLSEDGQNVIVDGFMHSVRKDFKREPAGARSTQEISQNHMPINWENCLNHRDEIQLRFDQALAMRVR